jgi:hypothetical protein
LPDADARQRALEKIIQWLKSQPESEAKNSALANSLEILAKTDFLGALVLAESLSEAAGRDAVLARLWLNADAFSVWQWFNRLDLPQGILAPADPESLSTTTNAPI